MSDEVDSLVKKCVELRKEGRLEEAILAARRATSVDPESANAWWQLALAVSKRDGAGEAKEYFQNTVDLSDGFAYGWEKLGDAHSELGESEEALDAWEAACDRDPELESSRFKIVDKLRFSKDSEEKERLLRHLTQLYETDSLRTDDYHTMAIALHNQGKFQAAIPLYERFLTLRDDKYAYSNLALAYTSKKIGRDLDAADICHLALELDEHFEPAQKTLDGLKEKLSLQSQKVRNKNAQHELYECAEWYSQYLSPFDLLDMDDSGVDEISIKDIQKAKKLLLQEIELEDGSVSWLPNLKVDRSRALRLADELLDETRREHHRLIRSFKPLLNFLSKGDLELFAYDPTNIPTEIRKQLEFDEDFAKWLADIYSTVFGSIFVKLIRNRDVDSIEALLSGRRFVTPEFEQKCFEDAVRFSPELLDDLKRFEASSESRKPTLEDLERTLSNKNLGRLLEVLPAEFQDFQSEAAGIIRSVAIDCYNKHNDAELAKRVLKVATKFGQKSPSFQIRLDKDLAKLDELIKEERKDESRLSFGDKPFNITKEGVKYGDLFIPANDVARLRWGISVRLGANDMKIYEFKIGVGTSGANVADVSWVAYNDISKQRDLYDKCVNAIFSYLMPSVIENIQSRLAKGDTVYVDTIPITKYGITLVARGWISSTQVLCPWRSLSSAIENGEVLISTTENSKARSALDPSKAFNAWVLHILISRGLMK